MNNLPSINLPDNPSSLKILNMARLTEGCEGTQEEEGEVGMEVARDNRTDTTDEGSHDKGRYETDSQVTGSRSKTQPRQKKKNSAKDVGLRIYTSKSEGWPKVGFIKNRLLRGLKEKSYKITYTDRTKEEEIIIMIDQNQIDVTNCNCRGRLFSEK